MKFLLVAVNAKYIHSNPAIYSLRAYAGEEFQPQIALAEYTINQQMQDILADIYRQKPDAIGFSCYIWNWNIIQELLREIPKVLPEADLWLGGPEVSYDAVAVLLKFPQLRGIMAGEGEATFRELMQWYAAREEQSAGDAQGTDQRALAEIPGLCLPAGEGRGDVPFYTPAREPLDLSSIPFPYGDLESFENRIIYYESSRGCPYRCSYCLSSIDKSVRLRDMEKVKRELRFFLDSRVKQVKFVDRTFNCNRDHALEIWRFLLENDNGVTNFHFEISADILREEEIALLCRMRPGLIQLEIGVQSVNPQTIEAVRRVTDLEKLERAVAAIRAGHNIHQHLDLIAGLPYEDYESFRYSFNRVYAMRPEQLQLGFLKVLKGSAMQEDAAEYGIRYLDAPPYEVLYTRWLTYGEVLRLKKVEEMVELYYNSSQFTHTLPYLEGFLESPFALFEALADFYERKGYFLQSPSRAYRYQVLFDFAAEYGEACMDRCGELLLYDLYLRENLKSRPDFAMEKDSREKDSGIKEQIRKAYQAEKKQQNRMIHIEFFRYPVWDTEKMCGGAEESGFVLFDYGTRDPLNQAAGIRVLSEQEILRYGGTT